MKRLLLLTAIVLSGCIQMTGTYGTSEKVQVFVEKECIILREDKTNNIILAMTCEGQKAAEALAIFGTAGLARGDIIKKRTIRTYRQATTEWLKSNGRSCVIEATTPIFDLTLIGAENYIDCED